MTTLAFPELDEKQGKLDAKRKELADIFAQARDGGEGTIDLSKVKGYDDPAAAIKALNDEMSALGVEVDQLKAVRAAADNVDNHTPGSEPDAPAVGGSRKSFGELAAKSGALKTFGAKTEIAYDVKTLMSRAAGWSPESLREPGYVPAASAPIMVLDLIPTTPTSQSSIKYMEQTTRTNAAAERAEGAAYGEAAFALTERSVPIETIGVWLPVTDEQLEDEEEVADLIDSELPLMCRQRFDLQVLVGDGSTPNIQGINGKSGVQTQAKGADPTPDAIYKGMTKVKVTGRAMPNAVVMHPNDWQDVRLLRTPDGIYIWGSPSEPGPARIWGLTVAESDNQTENTAVVGDFANWARLRVKRDIVIERTNSHDTFFINGKQAVRAGFRAAAVWKRPAAFCKVTGI